LKESEHQTKERENKLKKNKLEFKENPLDVLLKSLGRNPKKRKQKKDGE